MRHITWIHDKKERERIEAFLDTSEDVENYQFNQVFASYDFKFEGKLYHVVEQLSPDGQLAMSIGLVTEGPDPSATLAAKINNRKPFTEFPSKTFDGIKQ